MGRMRGTRRTKKGGNSTRRKMGRLEGSKLWEMKIAALHFSRAITIKKTRSTPTTTNITNLSE